MYHPHFTTTTYRPTAAKWLQNGPAALHLFDLLLGRSQVVSDVERTVEGSCRFLTAPDPSLLTAMAESHCTVYPWPLPATRCRGWRLGAIPPGPSSVHALQELIENPKETHGSHLKILKMKLLKVL